MRIFKKHKSKEKKHFNVGIQECRTCDKNIRCAECFYMNKNSVLNEEVEKLKKLVVEKHKENNELHEYLQYAKSEAVKEFAKRAVNELSANYSPKYCHWIDDTIDNLVKEMAGEME